MRRILQVGVAGGLLVLAGWWYGSLHAADKEQPAPPPVRIARVDMARIFKHDPEYEKHRASLQKRFDESEADLQNRLAKIEQMQAELKSYKADSAQYRELEVKIRDMKSEWDSDKKVKKVLFASDEAALYEACTWRIRKFIQRYADKNGIQLVVRSGKFEIGPDDPKQALERVRNEVVYCSAVDITDAIIETLR